MMFTAFSRAASYLPITDFRLITVEFLLEERPRRKGELTLRISYDLFAETL
jgi:hypothetical protein